MKVILPAYNEELSLKSLIPKILGLGYGVIVVNDGSSDATGYVADGFRSNYPCDVEVIHHPENRGLGAAVATGLAHALQTLPDTDWVVLMDADDTHDPSVIATMTALASDVVIASRFQPGSKVVGLSMVRTLLSTCASILLRVIVPVKGVRDYSCGYRLYKLGAIRRVANRYGFNSIVTRSGFECMVELLLKLRQVGSTFGEVPFTLRYDQKQGASKMRIVKTITGYMTLLREIDYEA